jgi:hypothetical protein
MSYYKVTFAVESKALSTTLETLSLGMREGVISKSFVVEREEELLNPAAHVETPPRIKATATDKSKIRKRGRSKGVNVNGGQLKALADHARAHGASTYAGLADALQAAAFSRAGAGSAITRAVAHGILRKQEDGSYSLA